MDGLKGFDLTIYGKSGDELLVGLHEVQAKYRAYIQQMMQRYDSLKAERDALIIERDILAHQLDDSWASREGADILLERAEAERNALAAQVEALRSAIEPFATGGVCSAIDREDYSIMRERIKDWHGAIEFKKAQDAYNSTPQQCLREIEANAGQAGWNACVDWLVENSSADLFTDGEVDQARQVGLQYAESVRKGGAE